jgi:tRNA pseudouridine38-40 synthase
MSPPHLHVAWLTRSNFHNYTIGKPFSDRSVKRFMITIDVSDPTLYGDIEWISVKIHGQSFMLHQIVSSLIIFDVKWQH